ncbi:DesA family fatty acid desaturase [Candidatus Nitrotoga sp. 1052]|uniref:DesA family fatty acid desaturase n=1 Tax=Candidatus Nitrotoga sp. 1052 TaxID=2886964 RepID=UPI001EF5579D|nr:fatty acid desaturase [Candidatus Nitrotoga sp. 1052]CAH1083961.1 Fatty acid desaturase [Candidatus Nitrotoga sp. 1052]
MFSGFIDLPWWGYIVVTLTLTHITIASVTIFLHRHQAHRALNLHAVPSHFFRFWLWLTTAIVTKEWVAIHRKHHAKCETEDDPHSPVILGIKKVLLEGAALYRKEAQNQETLDKYGHGTPNDWLENNLYSKRSELGITLMLIINVLLFGPLGLTIWAVQMAWIPINAAGIVNGIGHYWGYRNFQTADASTNIVPWGIFIGGEELHNNHHAYASSAKLSNKWYEIDIGWFYIRVIETFGLAQVKRRAPRVRLNQAKTSCDMETLHAVIANRYEVTARYAQLLKKTYSTEIARLKLQASDKIDIARIKHWLHLDENVLTEQQKTKLSVVIKASGILRTTYTLRQELAVVWQNSTATKEQLVKQLEDWCHRAENSGIAALQEFSQRLRCYA